MVREAKQLRSRRIPFTPEGLRLVKEFVPRFLMSDFANIGAAP